MKVLIPVVILATLFPVFFWLAKTFGEGGWGGSGRWPNVEIAILPLVLLLIVGVIILIIVVLQSARS